MGLVGTAVAFPHGATAGVKDPNGDGRHDQ